MESKKNNTFSKVVIFLLIMIIIGMGYYILYEKVLINLEKPQKKFTNKDGVSAELIQKLHSELISSDNSIGLYFKDKIDAEKEDDFRFISFNVKNYILDNSIKISTYSCGTNVNVETTYEISKDDIRKYINEKYNNNVNYNLPVNKKVEEENKFYNNYNLLSLENDYGIICTSADKKSQYVLSEITAVEEKDEFVYISDTSVICYDSDGLTYCVKQMDDTYDEAIFDCSNYGDNSINKNCPKNSDNVTKEMAEYSLSNLSKKLNIYKHTFKKHNNEYYYVSSEVIE